MLTTTPLARLYLGHIAASAVFMAFHENGFRSNATPMGQPAATSAAGETRQNHTYVTNDDRAAVETSEYFDALLSPKRVKKGDQLDVTFDVDGTVGRRNYVIDIVSSHVVLVPVQADDANGGAARAVVPTADGLTTGLMLDTDEMVEITSGGATDIVTLPSATSATRGRQILAWVVPSTNCECRTPASSGQTINGVDSDGTQQALLAHSHFYRFTQHLDDGWLMEKLTALGAVATAVVPD